MPRNYRHNCSDAQADFGHFGPSHGPLLAISRHQQPHRTTRFVSSLSALAERSSKSRLIDVRLHWSRQLFHAFSCAAFADFFYDLCVMRPCGPSTSDTRSRLAPTRLCSIQNLCSSRIGVLPCGDRQLSRVHRKFTSAAKPGAAHVDWCRSPSCLPF
jgi:hypothetical protein